MTVFLRRLGVVLAVLIAAAGILRYLGPDNPPAAEISTPGPAEHPTRSSPVPGIHPDGDPRVEEALERLQSLGFQPVDREDPPPAFELPGMDGQKHSLKDYRGRLVLMNFWASWCPPCREEMPSMQRLWERYRGEGLVIVGLNLGEGRSTVRNFMNDYGLTFPVLLDREGAVSSAYRVSNIPTTWVIGPDGRPLARLLGPLEWDRPKVTKTFEELLEETRVDGGDNGDAR